jgi:hypothetical protein
VPLLQVSKLVLLLLSSQRSPSPAEIVQFPASQAWHDGQAAVVWNPSIHTLSALSSSVQFPSMHTWQAGHVMP